MCEQLNTQLRASEIARRRTEEKRAEALFLCERRQRRRIQSAMCEQLKTQLRASEIARRRTEEKRAEAFFPLRATTTAADLQARCASS